MLNTINLLVNLLCVRYESIDVSVVVVVSVAYLQILQVVCLQVHLFRSLRQERGYFLLWTLGVPTQIIPVKDVQRIL